MSQPRQLKNAVHEVAAQAIGRDWSLYSILLDHWHEIVGEELAERTSPVKIMPAETGPKNRRGNGVLHIRLPRGLAMEMQYKLHHIQTRVNGFFGYEAITRIVLEHDVRQVKSTKNRDIEPQLDSEDQNMVATATAAIEDNELKAATAALAEAMLLRAKKQG